MVLTLILIVVWDMFWSEFVVVPYQGLCVLVLILELDIPGPRYGIFFSIRTFKLVVASFVKFVVNIWSVNIWFGKSTKKPSNKSRVSSSIRPTSNFIINQDDLRTGFETFLFVWSSKLILNSFLEKVMLVGSIGF